MGSTGRKEKVFIIKQIPDIQEVVAPTDMEMELTKKVDIKAQQGVPATTGIAVETAQMEQTDNPRETYLFSLKI